MLRLISRNTRCLLAVMVIGALIFSLLPALPAQATGSLAKVAIAAFDASGQNPLDINTLQMGTKFYAKVMAYGAQDLMGMDVTLQYNPDILEVTTDLGGNPEIVPLAIKDAVGQKGVSTPPGSVTYAAANVPQGQSGSGPVNGDAALVAIGFKVKAAGPINLAFDRTSADFKFTDSGANLITPVAVQDLNSGTADTTPPVITINGVQDGECTNRDVTLSISASDNQDGDVTSGVYATLRKDGSPLTYTPGMTLSDQGVYVLDVEAADAAGNKATAHRQFTIDKTAPVLSVTGVENGKTYSNVTINFTASDAFPVSSQPTVSASLVKDGGQPQPFTSGSSVNEDGSYTLTLTAADAAGNQTTQSYSFTIDSNVPGGSVTIVPPASSRDPGYTGCTAVTLRFNSRNAAQVRVANSAADLQGAAYQDLPAGNEMAWTLTGSDGPKAVYAQFRSAAGVESPVITASIILDTTPPTVGGVVSNARAWSRALASGQSLPLTLQVSGGDDVYDARATVTAAAYAGAAGTVVGDVYLEKGHGNFWYGELTGIPAGVKLLTIAVTMADRAGNVGIATVPLNIGLATLGGSVTQAVYGAGTVSGEVYGIEGATVVAWGSPGGGGLDDAGTPWYASTTTGAGGAFTLTLPAGSYQVAAFYPGGGQPETVTAYTYELDLGPGASNLNINLALPAEVLAGFPGPVSVQGYVYGQAQDETGNNVEGAVFTLLYRHPGANIWLPATSGSTVAGSNPVTGDNPTWGVPAGKSWTLWAAKDGYLFRDAAQGSVSGDVYGDNLNLVANLVSLQPPRVVLETSDKVDPAADLVLAFTKPILAGTLADGAVTLKINGHPLDGVTVQYDASTHKAIVKHPPLEAGQEYTLAISKWVLDELGQPLRGNLSWQFAPAGQGTGGQQPPGDNGGGQGGNSGGGSGDNGTGSGGNGSSGGGSGGGNSGGSSGSGSGSSGGSGGTTNPAPVTSTRGQASINPVAGGSVSLGTEVQVQIPGGALQGTATAVVKIEKVANPPALPPEVKPLSSVYEFSINGQDHYTFSKPVTLTLTFDPAALAPGEKPAVYYYDDAASHWVSLGGSVSGNTITVTVSHFTRFAVMAAKAGEPVIVITFNDVPPGYWAYDDIAYMAGKGYIHGVGDGLFAPDREITRAEFTAILVNILGLNNGGRVPFADVPAGAWYYDSIARAYAGGLVKGLTSTQFGPEQPVTREEMAVFVARAAGLTATPGGTSFADDASISPWARDTVAVAASKGLVRGYPDNTFRPQSRATRAEGVAMLLRALRQNLF